jgi:hypothetical protein
MYPSNSLDYDPNGEAGGPNDLTGLVNGVNDAGLCGANDWRAPRLPELMGIADMGLPAPTDRLTGLVWRRFLEGASFDGDRCASKSLALSWVKTLTHARHEARDTGVAWRLPNVKELASLLLHKGLPHIDTQAFPGGKNDMLWSSSSFPTDPTPRCVDFIGGHTFACSQGLLIDYAASRLVRDQ